MLIWTKHADKVFTLVAPALAMCIVLKTNASQFIHIKITLDNKK